MKPNPKPVRCEGCGAPGMVARGNHSWCPWCYETDECCGGGKLWEPAKLDDPPKKDEVNDYETVSRLRVYP